MLSISVGSMLHNLRTEIWASEVKLHISRNQTTVFYSYEKSYTFLEHMSTRFFNAIITDFELQINNLPATVDTICFLDTRKSAILESTWTKREMTSIAPKEFSLGEGGRGKLVSTDSYGNSNFVALGD